MATQTREHTVRLRRAAASTIREALAGSISVDDACWPVSESDPSVRTAVLATRQYLEATTRGNVPEGGLSQQSRRLAGMARRLESGRRLPPWLLLRRRDLFFAGACTAAALSSISVVGYVISRIVTMAAKGVLYGTVFGLLFDAFRR